MILSQNLYLLKILTSYLMWLGWNSSMQIPRCAILVLKLLNAICYESKLKYSLRYQILWNYLSIHLLSLTQLKMAAQEVDFAEQLSAIILDPKKLRSQIDSPLWADVSYLLFFMFFWYDELFGSRNKLLVNFIHTKKKRFARVGHIHSTW